MFTYGNHHKRHTSALRRIFQLLLVGLVLYSCASVGRPEGGPKDETPPRFVSSSPAPGALNSQKEKISILFDEFIKLEKASEKVVISPPQVQQPEIKANGKRVVVVLRDTLKANTTYTMDFGDAIQDNNEGNALENFSFTFSTGDVIDSMVVSGTLLNAEDLEPVKGLMVGLHANLADSAFRTLPFDRVGRTDSRGRFSIRGIAPGSYRIYGLQDADQNYAYTQPTEVIAFGDSLIVPSMEPRTRQDTTWIDSLTVDTVVERLYTHFLPDDIMLRCFKERTYNRRLARSERLTPEKFSLYFTAPDDSLPRMKGLNFDERDAFIIETPTGKLDTLTYWLRDTLMLRQDTLSLELTYHYTDSLNQLVPRTDTLNLVAKLTYAKQQQQKLEAKEKARKEREKQAKKKRKSVGGDRKEKAEEEVPEEGAASAADSLALPADSLVAMPDTLDLPADTLAQPVPNSLTLLSDSLTLPVDSLVAPADSTAAALVPSGEKKRPDSPAPGGDSADEEEKEYLEMEIYAPSSFDVYDYLTFTFKEPLARIDTAGLRLQHKVDTLWQAMPFDFERDSLDIMRYNIYADWEFDASYSLEVDSTTFCGLYGLFAKTEKKEFKVKKPEDYGQIFFNVTGAQMPAFVELLDEKDNVLRTVKLTDGKADFYFLNPGKYCARLVEDVNDNGVWDTGNYDEKRQPECVYYYPQVLELKANFDLTQTWSIHDRPLDQQKPNELKKQKPDNEKKNKTSSQR